VRQRVSPAHIEEGAESAIANGPCLPTCRHSVDRALLLLNVRALIDGSAKAVEGRRVDIDLTGSRFQAVGGRVLKRRSG
jgi:hypothetical protein